MLTKLTNPNASKALQNASNNSQKDVRLKALEQLLHLLKSQCAQRSTSNLETCLTSSLSPYKTNRCDAKANISGGNSKVSEVSLRSWPKKKDDSVDKNNSFVGSNFRKFKTLSNQIETIRSKSTRMRRRVPHYCEPVFQKVTLENSSSALGKYITFRITAKTKMSYSKLKGKTKLKEDSKSGMLNKQEKCVSGNLSYRNRSLPSVNQNKFPPLSPAEMANTKRIYFARRAYMVQAKIIIFNFEGVIGDYFQHYIWLRNSSALYIRPKATSLLENWSKKYQIVIIFKCSEERAMEAIEYLNSHGGKVDGAYISIDSPWSQLPITYDQIYLDFGLTETSFSRILVFLIY